MAPTEQKMKSKNFTKKESNLKKSDTNRQTFKKKRKWIPDHKVFQGSVKEGQGFAFKRKEKFKHEYNRLLRKERKKKNPESNQLYKEEYPEHLRHLYVAEAEKLRNEAWTNRVNRSKQRIKGGQMVEAPGNDAEEEVPGGSEVTDPVSEDPEPTAGPERESLPMSNRMKKRMQKKSSYQKSKEEFERIKEKRRKKKEEYEKNKQQREEAIQKYKQKKMETFQMLNKKTKKGQPNLNLQMDYLLQKIQKT